MANRPPQADKMPLVRYEGNRQKPSSGRKESHGKPSIKGKLVELHFHRVVSRAVQ